MTECSVTYVQAPTRVFQRIYDIKMHMDIILCDHCQQSLPWEITTTCCITTHKSAVLASHLLAWPTRHRHETNVSLRCDVGKWTKQKHFQHLLQTQSVKLWHTLQYIRVKYVDPHSQQTGRAACHVQTATTQNVACKDSGELSDYNDVPV
jgi:hypothetical protein